MPGLRQRQTATACGVHRMNTENVGTVHTVNKVHPTIEHNGFDCVDLIARHHFMERTQGYKHSLSVLVQQPNEAIFTAHFQHDAIRNALHRISKLNGGKTVFPREAGTVREHAPSFKN